jgi:hypothetical protein
VNPIRFLVGFNHTNVPAVEVPQVLHEPAEHSAWCQRCDRDRPYDILPGTPASRDYGAIPAWAFCCHCGWLLDIDLEESA